MVFRPAGHARVRVAELHEPGDAECPRGCFQFAPADLRDATRPELGALPFSSLYLLDDEFAAEIANRTMHGVIHLGWVPDGTGGFRGQLAILVNPNGLLGRAYMAAIRPFRYLIVYPALMRGWERAWRRRVGDPTPAHVH